MQFFRLAVASSRTVIDAATVKDFSSLWTGQEVDEVILKTYLDLMSKTYATEGLC